MKIIVFLLMSISLLANSEEMKSCDFKQDRELSFVGANSKDRLTVIVRGDTCQSSKLELILRNESGNILHTHNESFSRWYWPGELREKILAHAHKLLNDSIGDTSNLKTTFACEIEEPNCEPYERNVIPMKEYLALKQQPIPMISHSTYYEGWASWVYDTKLKKIVKVYEAGL